MAEASGISLPRKVMIKRGAAEQIAQLLSDMKLGKKCALFCDEITLKIIGDKIAEKLSDFSVAKIIVASTDIGYLTSLSSKLERQDFCIAVGGGKVIDACKYAAFAAGKPWLSVPTVASHDGFASSSASLEENGKRTSVGASAPEAIIADLDIIKNAPYRFTASGAGDALSKASSVKDWKIADKAGKEKYHEIIAYFAYAAAQAVMDRAGDIAKQDYNGLEMLVWALAISGISMSIYGSSRPASGSEHNFSHALEALGSKALHGEQVALGTIVSVYLQGGDWKKIKNVKKVLKLPTTAKELGISEEIIIKALVGAKNVRDRYTILNEINIDDGKAREILKSVGII